MVIYIANITKCKRMGRAARQQIGEFARPRGWRILPYKLHQTLNLLVHKLISVRSLRKTGLEQLKTKVHLSKKRKAILDFANLAHIEYQTHLFSSCGWSLKTGFRFFDRRAFVSSCSKPVFRKLQTISDLCT